MSNLYLGSPAQIEKQLALEVAAAKKDDPFYPVTVIVDNNLVGTYLRRSLAGHFGSYCRVRFITLQELAAELSRETEEACRYQTLPFYGEEWLAALIARQKGPKSYFDPVAESHGFSQVLLRLFRELEENMIEQVPAAEEAEPARIEGLQHLYTKYRQQMDPYNGKKAGFRIAQKALPPDESFKLIIFGLYNLSALEKELVKALLDCRELDPAVLWHSNTQRFSLQHELLQWYIKSGVSVSDLETTVAEAVDKNNLALLCKNFYDRENRQVSLPAEDSSLAFISAPDELQEVSEITREIIRLARQGVSFSEMAVFVPNSAYAYQCAASLDTAGIPFYRGGGIPLDQTRTGRSLLLFLDLAVSKFSRQKVFELLAYAPLKLYRTGGESSPVSPALWEQLALEAGIVRGKQQWYTLIHSYRIKLEKEIGEAEPAEERSRQEKIDALESLSDLVKKIFEAAGKITAEYSWSGFAGSVTGMIDDFFETGTESERIVALLKQLAGLGTLGGELDYKSALHVVQDLLHSATLPQGRFQRSGINLISTASAAGLQCKVIFIAGLNESVFPTPLQPDPLIPEIERRKLQGALPLYSSRFQREALHYILALRAAQTKAIVSWARFSAVSGRELFPSPFIYESGLALLGRRAGLDQLDQLPGYKYIQSVAVTVDPQDAISEEEYDLASAYLLPEKEDTEAYIKGIGTDLDRLVSADASRRRKELTPHQGLFAEGGRAAQLIESGFGNPENPAAVTALEDYARCPYGFFLKHLMEVVIIEEPEEFFDLPPQEKGLIIHRILELFYRQALEEKILPAVKYPDQCRKLLAAVNRDYFSDYGKRAGSDYHTLLWQVQRRGFEEMLTALLEWEIDNGSHELIPYYFEKRIGYPEDTAGFKLRLDGNRELFLKGRIDRIDRSESAFMVIDYKTGRKKDKNNSFGGGCSLQLPLYLLAVSRLFNNGPTDKDSAHYYFLSADDVKTVDFSGEDWPENEKKLQEVVGYLYRGITGGRYFPFPGSKGDNCRYCSYKTICGPEVARMINFYKAADTTLQDFNRFKEAY